MKRFMLRAALLTALALGAGPARADGGSVNPECLGQTCGAPTEQATSLWDDLLRWLGIG